MFQVLTTLTLTVCTGFICAVSLEARGSHPGVVIVWLGVGSFGGFCGGLAFAHLVGQLRRLSNPAHPPDETARTDDRNKSLSLDGVLTNQRGVPSILQSPLPWADAGWTVGMAVVIFVDSIGLVHSDWAYFVLALIPMLTAGAISLLGVRKTLKGAVNGSVGRTALALLLGLLAGCLTVGLWVGVGNLLSGIVALVVGTHLAVTLNVVFHGRSLCSFS